MNNDEKNKKEQETQVDNNEIEETIDSSIDDDQPEILEEDNNDEESSKDCQLEEYVDRLKRTMAEFDNYRKRTEKEKIQMYEVGAKEVLEKILPIIDNFERALTGLSEEEKSNNFAKGIEMIYKQLISTLEEMEVKPIETVGQPFNPNYHNAVQHSEDDDYDDNTIVEEYQKGYMYKNTVLRHSMVKVVN
ncbi:MAG: nucleotide exchange factor GrpE [Eubacteriales bacterium]